MKKVLLCPYNLNNCDVLRYRTMLIDYEIVGVLAPSGWGITGKDAGFVDGGMEIGIKIQDTIDYGQDFEGILIVANYVSKEAEQAILVFIKSAFEYDKKVIFAEKISPAIKEMCSAKPELVTYIKTGDLDSPHDKQHNEKIMTIDTPVIAVAGIHEFTHKFKVQLELRQYFKEKGYKISQIVSKQHGSLFGCHSFPEFMFAELDEKKKILGFNQYLKKIEKEERPDIIIIGIPGGIMPYSGKFPGYFGITAYEIMQAVTPDILIVNCLYEHYREDYFARLAQSIPYKYGVSVDCFNVSTFQVDTNESEQNGALQYFKLGYEDVEQVVASSNGELPVFNVMNGKDGARMAELVLNKLAEYGEADFV